MNVATITMTKEAALKKLAAYRASAQRGIDKEYDAAYQGYKALAKGTALLHIEDVIRAGGLDETHRPRLAVCRASAREVMFRWPWEDNRASFSVVPRPSWAERHFVRVDMQRWHNIGSKYHSIEGYALVPMIPADVRPKGNLDRFHVLWEVPRWADTSATTPPRDPYLLRHLGGALYAVVAAWDLSDLERAVMEGRGRR